MCLLRMFLLCFVLVLSNVCVLDSVNGAVIQRNDLFPLDIIHFNDFHDRFEETSIPYPICKSNDSSCIGGFPRMYQEIMTLLKAKPDALLLNAGDTYQGTYWYTLLKWHVIQKFINMLPIDVHAIGNHEFDGGISGLAPYLAGMKAPVVAANMDTSKEPSLSGLFKPHVVIEKKGRKIGVIGLITTDTEKTSNSENVIFLDPVSTVQKEAQLLTEQGVDIIIVLSHCGLQIDKTMAADVGENIDIIVGGHSHSLLYNGTSPSKEFVSGPYPVIVEATGKPGHKVLVVTASALSKYLGNLTTYFDEEGELQSFDGVPVFLNRSIPEDQEIKELLQPYKEKLDTMVNEVVGYTTNELMDNTCGLGECAIGNLVADAFRDAALQKHPTNLTAISFLLRNMIRGSIPKGNITRGSIINTLPFNNQLTTTVLKGRYLLDAIRHCITTYWVFKPFNGPMMSHFSALKVTLNTTSGQVVSASVPSGPDGQYEPVGLDVDYQFIAASFLINGKNGFKMLKENARDIREVGIDTDILENYVKNYSPLTPKLDNRLTIVN